MSSKLEFLEKLLGKCKYSHNTKEAEFYCCFCFHHKKKLSINVETDQWKCWVCGKGGKSLLYVIRKVGKSPDIKNYLSHFKAKNVRISAIDSAETKFSLSLPDDYRPLIHNLNTVYGKRAMIYLKNRGITEEDVLFYKIGISFGNDRIILPSFDSEGELNFYTTRAIMDGYMNHWSPSVPDGYKADCIFNELNIDWSKPVVLVEGFFDMMKANNAIPLFGSSMDVSYNVFQRIVHNQLPVYLAFDSDAVNKSQRIAELFLDYSTDVYCVDVTPYKDVGEMTKETFLQKMQEAKPFSRQSIFLNRLRMAIQ